MKQKVGLTNLLYFAAGNNLTGSLPEEMGVFTSLLEFDIFNNRVGGTIPGAISELSQLMSFDIESNLFEGQAFVGLSGLTDLASYRVSFNRFTGTIPAAVGLLTSLQELWVAGNFLEGAIPGTIATLRNLGTWDCSTGSLFSRNICVNWSSHLCISFACPQILCLSTRISSEVHSLRLLARWT
jgi:hypothetical protein